MENGRTLLSYGLSPLKCKNIKSLHFLIFILGDGVSTVLFLKPQRGIFIIPIFTSVLENYPIHVKKEIVELVKFFVKKR